MTAVRFIKMHGCGNDYVFLDCFSDPAPEDPNALAMVVSDRHRSIGSDGLVLMLPPGEFDADACMRMFNADGSEGALCGNALRCMSMWLHQSGRCGSNVRIAMSNRVMEATVVTSSLERRSAIVSVRIGSPVEIDPAAIGRQSFARMIALDTVPLPTLLCPPVFVSMGNPHTILFVASLDEVDVLHLGPLIEMLPVFPERTNVEFVQVTGSSTARVRVWERGSGETLACGSGACAVAVAGVVRGYFDSHRAAEIAMRGGNLSVVWDDRGLIHLQGPAEEGFRGTLNI